jgi:hypothetical protein
VLNRDPSAVCATIAEALCLPAGAAVAVPHGRDGGAVRDTTR